MRIFLGEIRKRWIPELILPFTDQYIIFLIGKEQIPGLTSVVINTSYLSSFFIAYLGLKLFSICSFKKLLLSLLKTTALSLKKSFNSCPIYSAVSLDSVKIIFFPLSFLLEFAGSKFYTVSICTERRSRGNPL